MEWAPNITFLLFNIKHFAFRIQYSLSVFSFSMEDDDMGMPSGKYARMDDEMGENKERFARENHSEVRRE